VGTASLSAWTEEENEEHRLQGFHGIQVTGVGEFTAASEESIAARPMGPRFIDRDGLSTLRLRVLGMAGRGYVEGVGETMYWLDQSRPLEGSVVRGKTPGIEFPAVHEMHFHLLLTTEALPGRTFRSINPAIMVNNNATSFPPKLGSRYVLRNVVELEDVNDPGTVVLRIVSNRNQIVGSGRSSLGRRPHEG
jgi:hypothetical protein